MTLLLQTKNAGGTMKQQKQALPEVGKHLHRFSKIIEVLALIAQLLWYGWRLLIERR
jgi:hypothetical protein